MNDKQVYKGDIFDLILRNGIAYIYYEYENAAIKATLEADDRVIFHVKLKDSDGNTREPFQRTMENSELVTEAVLAPVLISEEEYYNF